MSIDFFLLNRKCSQKLLTKFSHAEVCFFTEIPGKRLLYHQVSPVSRRGWGWWIQCFDSTGVRVGNSEKSLQYSWLLANRLLQSIVHVIAIYWHLMHHFNKKNTNIEKKQTRVFVGVFYVKKKKNGPPTFNIPTFSFHQNLVPGAACFLMLLLAWNSLAGTGRSFTAALTLLGANGVKDGTPMDLVGKIHENKNIC